MAKNDGKNNFNHHPESYLSEPMTTSPEQPKCPKCGKDFKTRGHILKCGLLPPTQSTSTEGDPYQVEVDDHSDDCGTVYRLKGPNVSILSKDEEMLKERAADFNLAYAQGQETMETELKTKDERWEKLKTWLEGTDWKTLWEWIFTGC